MRPQVGINGTIVLGLSGYNAESLTVDHSWQRVGRMPRSSHEKAPFFRKRVGSVPLEKAKFAAPYPPFISPVAVKSLCCPSFPTKLHLFIYFLFFYLSLFWVSVMFHRSSVPRGSRVLKNRPTAALSL